MTDTNSNPQSLLAYLNERIAAFLLARACDKTGMNAAVHETALYELQQMKVRVLGVLKVMDENYVNVAHVRNLIGKFEQAEKTTT